MRGVRAVRLEGSRNKSTSEYLPHSVLPLGCGHTVLCTLTHTQLFDADASCQMNQLLGANIDTTLRPILTLNGVESELSSQRIQTVSKFMV